MLYLCCSAGGKTSRQLPIRNVYGIDCHIGSHKVLAGLCSLLEARPTLVGIHTVFLHRQAIPVSSIQRLGASG